VTCTLDGKITPAYEGRLRGAVGAQPRTPGSGHRQFLLLLGVPRISALPGRPCAEGADEDSPSQAFAALPLQKNRRLAHQCGVRSRDPRSELLEQSPWAGAALPIPQPESRGTDPRRTALRCNAVLSCRAPRCSAAPRTRCGDGAERVPQLRACGCHHGEAGRAAKPWDSAVTVHGVS